jgi:hypothetical protein
MGSSGDLEHPLVHLIMEAPMGVPLDQESEALRVSYLRTLGRSHLAGPYSWPTPDTHRHWWPLWRNPTRPTIVGHELDESSDQRTDQERRPVCIYVSAWAHGAPMHVRTVRAVRLQSHCATYVC